MGTLAAWVRFSSDTLPAQPDLKTTCGIGIKLFGVPGPKLLGDGATQDFLLQNHDVFFVDTAVDMCEFTKAGVVDGSYDPYLETHRETDRILKEMKKVESSVLGCTYWSGLPYAFGDGRFVRYQARAHIDRGNRPDPPATRTTSAASCAAACWRARPASGSWCSFAWFQRRCPSTRPR